MVNEYKNVYGMIEVDDIIEELPIPEEIAHDTSLKSYLVINGEMIEAYYERVSTSLDKPAKVEQNTIIEKPVFFGKWEDKTQEYIKAHDKKKAKKKDNSETSSEDRPAADRTDELNKVEELLKQLLNGVN